MTEYEQEQLDAIKKVYYSEKPLYLHYSKDDKITSSSYKSFWNRSAIYHIIQTAFGGKEPEAVFKTNEQDIVEYFEYLFRKKKYYNGVLG